MSTQKERLVFGALLHDVGKVVFRGISGKGTHSQLGSDFIKEVLVNNADQEAVKSVVSQLSYHHADDLRQASISDDSLAYITYFADNISAGMDRKKESDEFAFDRNADLRKIFNILNGRSDDNTIPHNDYNVIRERIKGALPAIPISMTGVGSLLDLLEATCDTVPSSTNLSELIDVSLYDHSRTTAAIAACLYDYLDESKITDYKEALFNAHTAKTYYDKEMFLLWSCDLSGIQSFIYQISGSGALKQLRARSFYLDMLLEHSLDELLERLNLTRCNLLYTGGGHAYALLPNTLAVKEELARFHEELKSWLMDHFKADLYCSSAYVEASANDLMNKEGTPEGSKRYRMLFSILSERLSNQKAQRYTAQDIRQLNFDPLPDGDHSRECSECHRSDDSVVQGKCSLCTQLAEISPELIKNSILVVCDKGNLELPFGKYLQTYEKEKYIAACKEEEGLRFESGKVRVYSKNEWNTGICLSTHIWMGDYTAVQEGKGIGKYASSGKVFLSRECDELVSEDSELEKLGIERLGVLRADVDNLGTIFSKGLPDDKISISRTATLSRSLSYFFKQKINEILEEGSFQVQIIYSGGDDLFLIGNWCDVIQAARDIRTVLDEFTGNGVLTISAGLGMYQKSYPIARMAEEVGALESAAKSHPGKDAIALWSEEAVFSWSEFESEVCAKLPEIQQAFTNSEKGKAFIYQLLSLLRNMDNPISVPRLAYLLARSFEHNKEKGAETSKKFFAWATDSSQRRSLSVALEWYVYSIREKG